MKNTKIFLTSLILVFLCFSIYSLFADYEIKGNLSGTSKSSSESGDLNVKSRVGEPISGSSGNSSTSLHSGFGNFEQAVRAEMNTENQSAAEALASGDEAQQEMPTEFRLFENYPNPFNPTTTIRFDIPIATTVTIKIYDIRGQEVATLLRGDHREAGHYEMNFDAFGLSSGIYLYRITAGPYHAVKKMMLLK